MKSFFRGIFFLLIILGIIAVFLGYIGLIPQIARFLGTDKPRDLGIRFTDKIADEAKNKTGVDTKSLMPTANPTDSISYMGKHAVEASFNSEELTSLASDKPWKYYPVSKVQIRMKGEIVEISGILRTDRIIGYVAATGGSMFDLSAIIQKIKLPKGMIPFYIKGTGKDINNKVALKFEIFELGRLQVPLSIINPYYKQIAEFIEERVDFVRGASVESLTFEGGKMFFKGTLPDLEGMMAE